MDDITVAFQCDDFTVHRLSDGVFAAIATTGGAAISNAGILDLGGRTAIYDTCMTPRAGQGLRAAALQLTGREPDLVINSHYHNDHIWGNQAFGPESLIVSTRRTLQLMQTAGRDEVKWANEVSASRLQDARQQYESARNETQRQDARLWTGYFGGLVAAMPGLSVRFPDLTFDERLSIHGSSQVAELISFDDCHTGSDTILLLRERGIAFMADLLFVHCHPYLEECDVSKLRLMLEEVSRIGVTVLVPGHGPVGTLQDVASNIDYIDLCCDVARRIVATGDTSAERIARELPHGQFANWGLLRFFTGNLESLCAKAAAKQPPS